jgi:hypothetical protein
MKCLMKLFIIVDIETTYNVDSASEDAQATLDAFREATLPYENYGVSLYRATPEYLTDDLLRRQVEVIPLSDDPAPPL